jgi:hypothetical protein
MRRRGNCFPVRRLLLGSSLFYSTVLRKYTRIGKEYWRIQ